MRIAVVDDEAAMREQLVSSVFRFGQEKGLELNASFFTIDPATFAEKAE